MKNLWLIKKQKDEHTVLLDSKEGRLSQMTDILPLQGVWVEAAKETTEHWWTSFIRKHTAKVTQSGIWDD